MNAQTVTTFVEIKPHVPTPSAVILAPVTRVTSKAHGTQATNLVSTVTSVQTEATFAVTIQSVSTPWALIDATVCLAFNVVLGGQISNHAQVSLT